MYEASVVAYRSPYRSRVPLGQQKPPSQTFGATSMKPTYRLFTVAAMSAALACANVAIAADTETTPVQNAESSAYVAGKASVEKKDWKQAVAHFTAATNAEPKNADAWNMLGYASRWAGDYKGAFAAYGKALALDPKHKGAHSYLGVAYVKTNDLAKARAELASVQSLCGNTECEEYKLLNKAIAEYKAN
jgi:Flp pilus assembly protein TadD